MLDYAVRAVILNEPMLMEFYQHYWEHVVEDDFRQLLEIALSEDVNDVGDITSLALVDTATYGSATLTARQSGILAGMPTIPIITESVDSKLRITNCLNDTNEVAPEMPIAEISGPALSILAAERIGRQQFDDVFSLLPVYSRLSAAEERLARHV
jgi:hypothetical protein